MSDTLRALATAYRAQAEADLTRDLDKTAEARGDDRARRLIAEAIRLVDGGDLANALLDEEFAARHQAAMRADAETWTNPPPAAATMPIPDRATMPVLEAPELAADRVNALLDALGGQQ